MTFLRIVIPLHFLFEHDLFGKPVPAFPDHAPAPEATPLKTKPAPEGAGGELC
jgi:hypothetical protein